MTEPIKIKVYDPPVVNEMFGDERQYLDADTEEDLALCERFEGLGYKYVATYYREFIIDQHRAQVRRLQDTVVELRGDTTERETDV